LAKRASAMVGGLPPDALGVVCTPSQVTKPIVEGAV
jgi:hypothetical protein